MENISPPNFKKWGNGKKNKFGEQNYEIKKLITRNGETIENCLETGEKKEE